MASHNTWQTTTTLAVLQARAKLIGIFHDFFIQKAVLQVDTPIISQFANTDPSIESFTTQENINTSSEKQFFLQTSPEFPMKRLLASGVGSIYQICKVFRTLEKGRFHNPEFTLLEWYRVEIDHFQLMDEVLELFSKINSVFPFYETVTKLSYHDLFLNYLGIDILNATSEELKKYIETHSDSALISIANMQHSELCDYLMSHMIQDKMQEKSLIFVFNYPTAQASLAQLNDDKLTARRFEVFASGIELANGFHELRDAQEQHQRFLDDQKNRAKAQQAIPPLDENLIQALQHGLPNCAGVALGVERLLMLIVNAKHINEVLSFPFERA